VSLTSNFDFAVELGIAQVKEIFHLAFKDESLFPHNIGPIQRTYSGQQMTITVLVLDDETNPADLSFADETHIAFSFPFQVTVQIPGSPDPSLSQIVLMSQIQVPALLTSWTDSGQGVLGLSFAGITPAQVTVQNLSGLPAIDASSFKAAIDQQYASIQHTYTQGSNVLVLYDGTLDMSLTPPDMATPSDIEATIETDSGVQYLKVTAPIYVSVPEAYCASYGRVLFWREITQGDTSITVDFTQEPTIPALETQVQLDNGGPAASLVIQQLTPLVISVIGGFGVITEPDFTQAAAENVIANEAASYLDPLKFPVYSPQSGDPSVPLTTPVGFLLPADGVLAILMNRRDASVPDSPPDDFLGTNQVALAMGIIRFDEFISAAIAKQFPQLASGNQPVSTSQGSATLHTLNVTPSDPGTHGQSQGHLWVTGTATVHIKCWPDPSVSFDGPIFLIATPTETNTTCSLAITAQAGHFNYNESCCDTFLDIIIPIVGWIMLAVVDSTINEVGGELSGQIASQQGQEINAIPPVINGVAEVQACLENVLVSSQGVVMPGMLRIRRLGRSFQDLEQSGNLPRY
jgi:hypothetical protein